MFRTAAARDNGISIVEILVALAVVAVIASFASTSFSNSSNRAELQATLEGVSFSIQSARSTARTLETEVVMHLETDPHSAQHSITFSFPHRNAELGSSNLPQEFQFPTDILLVADESSIRFDSRGLVAVPVQLQLVSKTDERLSESVLIQ